MNTPKSIIDVATHASGPTGSLPSSPMAEAARWMIHQAHFFFEGHTPNQILYLLGK